MVSQEIFSWYEIHTMNILDTRTMNSLNAV